MSNDETTRGAVPAPEGADRTVGDLVTSISADISTLVHQEMELVKTELRQEVASAGQGAGLLGGAGVTGLYVIGFGSLTAVYALAHLMDIAWAALIVTVFWAIVTAVLALGGKSKLSKATPPLEQTKLSLKEDAQWVKTRKS